MTVAATNTPDHPRAERAADGVEVVDVVGIGFGPSNLALAVALAEHNAAVPPAERLSYRFVERQERFGWHRGMLLEDATMQISYLKDLVTLRNPTSPFTFLAYLHDRDRLVDFINYGSAFPTRLEFHDYLEWAAQRFAGVVEYGAEVTEIVPVEEGGTVGLAEVVGFHSGSGPVRIRARNVVLATGLTPNVPRGVTLGPRVWHNRDLLHRAPQLRTAAHCAVVGAGQSAAETVDYLHRTYPEAEVHAVFARYGYSPADDSSFANRIFDPAAVDDFYAAPAPVKKMIMGYHANTNYSVVDPDLITELYRRHYHERVAGRERLRFHNVSRVADVVDAGDRVELAVESLIDGARDVLTADVVVYATGYRPTDPLWLLDPALAAACTRDDAGRAEVRRDYRLATGATPQGRPVHVGLFVQGATEHTHGITSTLLSTVAVRAGEIAAALAGATAPAPTRVLTT
ncbi:lysine N(6)-hydroxylase/L-ornithine N(5)-oxygenase family protein [Pseudonocardia kujensis]|uniref:lysine N(6)-hydroxylase/L-ornithine N(5)-oxygenase family protein n=1 Tax=Pseudonocardia kujensis TaxID=1128675 RepID=UPI001E6103E8|nr:SidA/IucD/PvdA family monooxygenase [Pseudonocardia kujensis]MCE0768015.1 lysine N(6)-hydroxylase/L-ornithine N(5)-oxygenase family protein [Pseudonocardia kujensis]